jgi:putative membrane protein
VTGVEETVMKNVDARRDGSMRLRAAAVIGGFGVALSMALGACAGSTDEAHTPPPPPEVPAPPAPAPEVANPPPPVAATPPPPKEEPMTDGQIAAIVTSANTGEIAQAKLAQKNAKDAKVKAFAAMMVDHHGKNQKDAEALTKKLKITLAPNPVSDKIDAEGKDLMVKLSAEKGADFDRDYMDAQIKEHTAVLSLFDDKLIPGAKAPELKQALTDFRPKIAAHLKSAQDLQVSIAGKK